MRASRLFLESSTYKRLTNDRRVVIVDGGARGGVEPPLDRIPAGRRTTVRFEPEPDAPIISTSDEVVFRKALWSGPTKVKLHVTQSPSCSSVYPPDYRLVSTFVDILGRPARDVRKEVEVEADSIDHSFESQKLRAPDFIKLDIHSAEYEALEGAKRALESSTIGLLIECWPVPIHLGQRTFPELDSLVSSKGFLPFEIAVGCWARKPPVPDLYASKNQSVQFEILYLKDVVGRDLGGLTVDAAATLIGFAELFGQVTYAMQVAAHCHEKGLFTSEDSRAIRDELMKGHRVSPLRHFVSRAARRTQRMLDALVVNVAGR